MNTEDILSKLNEIWQLFQKPIITFDHARISILSVVASIFSI